MLSIGLQVGLRFAIYGTLPALALQLLSSPAMNIPEAVAIVAASFAFSAAVAAISWYSSCMHGLHLALENN